MHKLGIRYISPYLPSQSGIATFTADLMQAIHAVAPHIQQTVTAITWHDSGQYPTEVVDKIRSDVRADYQRAAIAINEDPSIDVVCIQHEFGLYGGRGGTYILDFVRNLKKPFVITFHSVPVYGPHPFRSIQLRQIRLLSQRAASVVLPMPLGRKVIDRLRIPRKPLTVIPHGIPTIAFKKRNITQLRRNLQMDNTQTLLTFGLIRRTKGIEVVIRALPELRKAVPSIRYIVLGDAPRPKDQEYLAEIQQLAQKLGVADIVRFDTQYLAEPELLDYLAAADICIMPYTVRDQISSGTVLWSFATGTPLISTNYVFAEYALANHRGILVGFSDSDKVTQAVMSLIDHPIRRERMINRAHDFANTRQWPNVASSYARLYESLIENQA